MLFFVEPQGAPLQAGCSLNCPTGAILNVRPSAALSSYIRARKSEGVLFLWSLVADLQAGCLLNYPLSLILNVRSTAALHRRKAFALEKVFL